MKKAISLHSLTVRLAIKTECNGLGIRAKHSPADENLIVTVDHGDDASRETDGSGREKEPRRKEG